MHGFPQLGVGISYRPLWRQEVLAHREHLDCLEVIAEHYLRGLPEKLAELDQLGAAFPIIPHGIGLSFGTDAPLDAAHLRHIAQLVERIQPAWFSEHIAFTRVPGWDIGHLASLPFTHATVAISRRELSKPYGDDTCQNLPKLSMSKPSCGTAGYSFASIARMAQSA